MAEAAPHRSPELTIVLFNVHSNDKGVKAPDRHECLKEVVDSVLSDASRDSSPGSLFFLCQESIKTPKHKILCQKLEQSTTTTSRKEEAGIYFNQTVSKTHTISYMDDKTLRDVDDGLGLDPDNPFALARLRACDLQLADSEGGLKILLVSWHGPYTKAQNKINRMRACFRRLIRFCERLRQSQSFDTVVIGGDFNLTSQTVLSEMKGFSSFDAAVLGDYTPTEDRLEQGIKDFIVYWPQHHLQIVHTHVVRPDFRREKGQRPFDHNIVAYRFGNKPSETVEQPASSELRGSPMEIREHDQAIWEEYLTDLMETIMQKMNEYEIQIAKLKEETQEKDEDIWTLRRLLILQRLDNGKQKVEEESLRRQLQQLKDDHEREVQTLRTELDQKNQHLEYLQEQLNQVTTQQGHVSPQGTSENQSKHLAESLLKEGRMPLFYPAKRTWRSGTVVQLPAGRSWPPGGWEDMGPRERFRAVEEVARFYQKRDAVLGSLTTQRELLDTLGMLILPQTDHPGEDSELCQVQTTVFKMVKSVAKSRHVDACAQRVVSLLALLPRPGGITGEVITALEGVPLRIR